MKVQLLLQVISFSEEKLVTHFSYYEKTIVFYFGQRLIIFVLVITATKFEIKQQNSFAKF